MILEKNDYINVKETETLKYIWGVESWDNIGSGDGANLYTMNDLDVLYLKDEGKYMLSVETIYMFDNESSEYGYMRNLLDKFTDFMEQNEYDTTHEFTLSEVFTDGININTHFNSIEECYAAFKMFVNGFCSLENKN